MHAYAAASCKPSPSRHPRVGRRRFVPRRLSAALAACALLTLSPGVALSPATAAGTVLPTGPTVGAGQAQVVTAGTRMTVTNTPQAILNWTSFSISNGASVYFQQADAASQVLNRVTGNDPSQIFGSLGSNGRVWLLNPNGVLFGASARVDVAGLVASTLRLGDSDWLAGRYRFSAADGVGANPGAGVLNQGEIRTSLGGTLALVGGSVGNEGLMQAPGGQVVLAAGRSVELVDTGAANLSVRITAPAGEARNLGVIEAAGGRIDITAAAVNQQGVVRADALSTGPGGEIWIRATDGRSSVAGTVSAQGGSEGVGGQVVVLGREVALLDGANVDVSGGLGGGGVIAGGGLHGKDARYANAQALYMAPGARIAADAKAQGDGGNIVLWSDTATRAFGHLSARGGLLGGNGGYIETSGGWLDARPVSVDTSAPRGRAGEWLLDPYGIVIGDFVSDTLGTGPDFTAGAGNSSVRSSTIVAALNGGSNVTVYTGGVNGGAEHGDITASSANIVSNAATPGSLTLRADGNIVLSNTVIASSGPMSVTLLAGLGGDGYISMLDSTISTGTGASRGNILLGGTVAGLNSSGGAFQGAGGSWNEGVFVQNSTLDAGSANVAISGVGLLYGVQLNAGTQLTGRNVTVVGQGTDATAGIGVRVASGASIDADKSITIDGRGTDVGASVYANAHLYVQPTTNDPGALLSVSGRGGRYGILVSAGAASSPAFRANSGASISLTGSGATNYSVQVEANQSNAAIPVIDNTGGTNLTISGVGAGQDIIVSDNLVLGGNGLMLLQATQDVYLQNAATGIAANKSLVAGDSIWILDGATLNGSTGTTQLTAAGGITFTNGSRLNVFGPTTLSGGSVSINNSSILSQPISATSLTINADTAISLNNSTIGTSNGGAMPVTLSGARVGSGQVALNDSSINAVGADITIGGTTSITGPTGPIGAAGGDVPVGVQLSNSTVAATGSSPTIRLAGYSTQAAGQGVTLQGNSVVSAAQVFVAGRSDLAGGILMLGDAYIEGLNQVLLTGNGAILGVLLAQGASVRVQPPSFNASAALGVTGNATGFGGSTGGVRLLNNGNGGSLRVGNGASITVNGSAAGTDDGILLGSTALGSAVVINASGGTNVTLNGVGSSPVRLADSAAIVTGSGPFTVQTAGDFSMSGGYVELRGTGAVNAGQIAVSNSAGFYSSVSPDITLTLNAAGNLSFLGSSVSSVNGAVNVNLLGRAGSVTLSNSSIRTGTLSGPGAPSGPQPLAGIGTFGNLVIGGDVAGTTPTGSAFTGAGGNVPTGVGLSGMTLNAGGGSITVAGVSDQSGGTGVALSGSSLSGGAVSITGAAPLGRGVAATGSTTVTASGDLSLLGRGADYGVYLQGAFQYSVVPPGFDATRVLLVQGRASTPSTGVGVWVHGDALGSPNLSVGSGASLRLEGASPATAVDLLASSTSSTLVSAGGGTNLFIGAFAPGGAVALRGGLIVGGDSSSILGSNTVDTSLLLDNTGLSAFGTVRLTANSVDLRGTTTVSSHGLGDAIIVSGRNVPLSYFDNTAGSSLSVLPQSNAPLGRWIVYAADTTGGPNFLNIGGLSYAFKRYGASFGAWAGDAGNGVVLAAAKSASVTAVVAPKAYDGTTTATLTNVAIAPAVSGDIGTLVAGAASFASPNAGTGLAVTFNNAQPFTFTDGSNRPVYGYTLTNNFTGTITRRVLTGSVTVADKPYDGTISASALVSGITGLVGQQTVLVTPSASFTNKNVGVGKTVTGSFNLQDGANGGLASNYQFSGSFPTASISAAQVAVTGVAASNKVYDASTVTTLTGTALVSVFSGDSVTLGGTPVANFANKNVGTGKAVTVIGYTLSGNDSGNYVLSQPAGLTANITPLGVQVTGLAASSKVYDAGTLAALSGTATVGALSGDQLSLLGTPVANFADKNVGNGKAVTVSGYTLSGNDAGNYSLSQASGLTANITPLGLQVSGVSASSKVYDANTLATLTGTATVNALGSDAVTLGGTVQANFADKNVGNGKPVGVSGYTLSGNDAANYTLIQPVGLSANITPLGLQVTGLTASNKVYDATTVATLNGTATVVGLGGDQLSLGGTVLSSFADKNVGNGKSVSVSGYTLSGLDAGNYVLSQPTGLRANITPLGLQVAGVNASNKVYDASTLATLTGSASVMALSGDSVSVGGTAVANFADKNVGNGKSVSVSGYTLQGLDAGNYTLSQPTGLSANITPLGVQVAGLAASNKVYDANTRAALTGTASINPITGDSVALGGTVQANFADKNVGNGKEVSVSGYTLSGRDAGNYTLTQPSGLNANITPLGLQVAGVSASNKVYDASTLATLTGSASVMALSGDSVSVGGTAVANFADKNVGNGKSVSVSGYTLQGLDAGNYTLSQPTGLSANITPLGVQVTGLVASNKVYDANTRAALTGTASINLIAGDSVALGGTVQANFADKNVGNGKAVSVSGYTLSGTDAGNYVLSQPTGLRANITPLGLQVAGVSASNKVYDASTLATLTGSASVMALSGDSVSVGGTAVANFADKNVGNGKVVGVSGYTLQGLDAGNYTLSQPTGLSANITPLGVQVAGLAASNKVYDAGTRAALTGTASINLIAGDSVALGGTVQANFADKNVGNGKVVNVSGYALSGTDAGNYVLSQPTGLRANITPFGLQVTGVTANSKVYDAGTVATLAGTAVVSALAGDNVSLGGAASAAFASKNVGNGKAVTVTGYTLGGADAANYNLLQPVGLSANITPLTLQVAGLTANNKVYDAGRAATVSGAAFVNPLAGDSVLLAGSAAATFSDKNVGNGKTVTVTGYLLAGTDAANYNLLQPTGLRANITPLGLQVSGLAAASKVYDGTTVATLSGAARVSPLAGDTVGLSGTAVGAFASRDTGVAKPVTVSGLSLSGADAGNYNLLAPQGLLASITPATLVYVAETAVRSVGQVIEGLLGSVQGFVPGETLTVATTGALSFTSPTAAGAAPGAYAIVGGGLQARNYVFTQAAGNAQALTIVDLTPNTGSVIGSTLNSPDSSDGFATTLSARRDKADGGIESLLDLPPRSGPVVPDGDFRAIRLASLSAGELQGLLAGRDLFKKQLFAASIARLESDPGLADLQECQTLDQARQGGCVVTEKLKAQVQRPAGAPAPAPSAAPSPAPAAAPSPAVADAPPSAPGAAPPAPPPAPVPAPAAAPPPAASPVAPPPAPAVDPLQAQFELLLAKRNVRTASLPQIERKIALVVGVGQYRDESIPALGNAVRDARAVARLFEQRLGYEAVVLDNATRSSLVAALNRLALTLGPRDSVVIYYAGHGELVESTKLGYWLLADSKAQDPTSWLSNTDITQLIKQMGASQVALVSDSCYSGSLASEERLRAQPGTVDPVSMLLRKSVVVMSSGGNEPVFDEGRDGHSPFAWNLMNQLGQIGTWQAGGNLFERVRFAVAREVPQRPQYSASRAAGHQPGGDYLFELRQLDAAK